MDATIPGPPPLRHIAVDSLTNLKGKPTLLIRTDEDVLLWRMTQGYQDFGLFLRRLSESVVGHFLPWVSPNVNEAVNAAVSLLDALDRWIDEIPPLPTPQRFGNLAFRQWGKRLQDNCDKLLSEFLPARFHPVIPFVSPYLLTSFGSFTRMDYGTGHETSFALFLLCLTLVRFFEPEPECERALVLTVFVRYLRLCWRLQDVYNLEPAGSHGVWGLDDYSFLGYIFGSAQLRDQSEIPVDAILRQPLPPTNLYFLSISRIHQVKHGPFHEHSSQLHSIATGVQHWSKVNSGLFKMYEAEVLGKRVVVQHIPLGGLLEWNVPSNVNLNAAAAADRHSVLPNGAGATQAPWAASGIAAPAGLPASTFYAIPRSTQHTGLRLSGAGASLHGFSSLHNSPRASPIPQRAHGSSVLVPGAMPLGPLSSTHLRPMSAPGSPRPTGAGTGMPPPAPPNPSAGGGADTQ